MTKKSSKRDKHRDQESVENAAERSEKTPPATEASSKDIEEESAQLPNTAELGEDALKELREKAEERDELFVKLQRATADYQNYQKRMSREMSETRKFALQDFLNDFLHVMDHFTRALEAGEAGNETESLMTGIKMVEDEIYKVLTAYGVESIKAVGEQFDPAFHEAVFSEETEEEPDHAILEELQRGFILHGRVIRPAKVKVAVRPQQSVDDNDTET